MTLKQFFGGFPFSGVGHDLKELDGSLKSVRITKCNDLSLQADTLWTTMDDGIIGCLRTWRCFQ